MAKVILLTSCLFLAFSLQFSAAENFPIRTESAQALFQKGLYLREQGKIEEAEWNIKRALEFEPANADYRFELANVYAIKYDRVGKRRVRAGNRIMLEYAARELEQVVMLNPDSLPAIFNLGVVRKKQGRFEDSREKFKHVLKMNYEIVNAHLQIASTYEDQGFYDEARDYYEQALELDFTNHNIRDSIEELKDLEASDRERELQRHYSSPYSRFEFSEYSRPRQYQKIQNESSGSRLGGVTAVPYLAMWLVEQFVQLREDGEEV